MNHLDDLNEPQKEAVLHKEGPLLVVAGAGAGKTRVITHRIAHLIHEGIAPEKILAVTFTNKAAQEMRDRVAYLVIGPAFAEASADKHRSSVISSNGIFPFVGTFHALGVRMLRENGHELGIPRRFVIKDKNDSLSLIKEAMREKGINRDDFEPRKIQSIISRNKGELKTFETYRDQFSLPARGAQVGDDYFPSVVADIWERYESQLKKERSLDFDDLLLKPVELLSRKKEVRAHYQSRWHHILIDEYQDTNHAQYRLSRVLAEKHKNICAVGDADQTVYSWRGANMKNLLRFERDYPDAKVVLLEENYRSTKTILDAANTVIEKNHIRIPKKLFTGNAEGEMLTLAVVPSGAAEARFVAEKSALLIQKGIQPEELAVLYRANFQSRALEEAFLTAGIPYQVLGTRFFERKEVKDMLAFIQAARNPESLGDIKRIINIPPRGVGKVTLAKLFAGQRETLPHSMQAKLANFYALLEKIRNASEEKSPVELIKYILKETGMETYLKKEGDEGLERLENIKELVTLAARYSPEFIPNKNEFHSNENVFERHSRSFGENSRNIRALEHFLEDAALAQDQDALMRERGGVRLMTVHAAKGLEFPYVFITGLEQGLFPSETRNYAEHTRNNAEDTEEERRLFYVALTRAQKKVFLSYAEMRLIFGQLQFNEPSEFLRDIPEHLVEIEHDYEHDDVGEAEEIEYD